MVVTFFMMQKHGLMVNLGMDKRLFSISILMLPFVSGVVKDFLDFFLDLNLGNPFPDLKKLV